MSSGSYVPPPVKVVKIPKPHGGGMRMLGVPTVADRVAQTVVARVGEGGGAEVPPQTPMGIGRAARRLMRWRYVGSGVLRTRGCWIVTSPEFFDNVPHDLIVKAVKANTDLKWVVLYVERWLKAPLQHPDGTLDERDRGTPQGSAISPLLVNLFLHYAFDKWMSREFPGVRSSAIAMT